MRLAVRSIELLGAARRVEFEPGLNIITGEITTGKTTLYNLIKGLLGTSWESFTPELQATTTAVQGQIEIGDEHFTVIRRLVTTKTSLVDVAGERTADRLPALESQSGELTYGEWLLDSLQLPRVRVPKAPTQVESGPVPVSIADYLNYCLLSQDDMGRAIFGHRDTFRNIKRRYVFQIVYGLLGVETARLMDQLRAVISQITAIESQQEAMREALAGTPWENRASLVQQLEQVRLELLGLRQIRQRQAAAATEQSGTAPLRSRVLELDNLIAGAENDVAREHESVVSLEELHRQLQSQAARLNRAIAAGSLLADYEFQRCPRCGSSVDQSRGGEGECLLCLQEPAPTTTRDDLIGEQERIADQARETLQLVDLHRSRIVEGEQRLRELRAERRVAAQELNDRTSEYVSDRADEVANAAADVATLEERVTRLEDYLGVFERLDAARQRLSALRAREEELRTALESDSARWALAEERIEQLDVRFRQVMNEFHAPNLGEPHINRDTLMPEVGGRSFDSLSSAGWKSLVSIAHAIAHHQTAIDLDLALPGLLIIDRPSTHIGDEGLDLERVNSIYRYLEILSIVARDDLQIIVIENSVPDFLRKYVRVHLTEDNRLIPQSALDRVEFKPPAGA